MVFAAPPVSARKNRPAVEEFERCTADGIRGHRHPPPPRTQLLGRSEGAESCDMGHGSTGKVEARAKPITIAADGIHVAMHQLQLTPAI